MSLHKYMGSFSRHRDSIRNKTNGYSEDKKHDIRGENAFHGLFSGLDLA